MGSPGAHFGSKLGSTKGLNGRSRYSFVYISILCIYITRLRSLAVAIRSRQSETL